MADPVSENDFRVVCLGGSAGGLRAYLDILRNIPGGTGMAFVIAPHRSPENAHLLPQILASVTSMPVVEVTDGMRLEPNHIFIMPARKNMTLDENVFHVRTSPRPRGWPKTINVFLHSLAEAKGDRSVAVIVSGMDADGSAALKTIKAAGGVTFAQSDPEYASMPLNAIETGDVDFFLPSSEIGKSLSALADRDSPPSR